MTIAPFRLPNFAHFAARLIETPNLVFVWFFALSLFDENFKLRWIHFCGGIIYCLPMIVIRLYQFGIITWYPQLYVDIAEILSVALMVHLIYTTLRGRKNDLLERRRRARLYFILILFIVAVIATFIDPKIFTPHLIPYETIYIISIWPAIIWTTYWLLGANKNAIAFGNKPPQASDINKRDKELLAKLKTIMVSEEAFKNSNLTIVTLANKMSITQHRLRSLINQTLGYQNFNSFLNNYRVMAIKKALRDSDKSHLPILTIALDNGFNSLSPFNRAFRESEKMTPTEYRKATE
ncbi:MAG: helix-turn-helix domain-containing protein [Litorimonas sp.]